MVIELMKSHASVRDYKEKQLTREEVSELIAAAQHAATSHFVQAYSIVWVTDPEKRKALGELSRNPQQMEGAGAVFLMCADYNRLKHAGDLQGETIVYDHAENLIVAVTDVALLAQNLALAAESKGYGICYIGGVRNNMEVISELVGLPEGVFPVYGLTVGVPNEANEVKPRLPVEAILHENEYDEEKYKTLLPEYDETIQRYYQERSTNQKVANWTEQMASFLKKPRRQDIKDVLAKKGFLFK
ncbi:NADPH-dependent oxidoreductase [Planococcus shenhongbingii]|uniref:NADPH-dependent oxidoreductase n=1 Tax=Planococcus shenhongbingii TaxID=3058398 RepID=A0ABT8NFH8_9BACL|nr:MULTISPECIES: NADPH-dependent oxidoreductase [unclassified Planococcus (in: firmicutes)]MDN7246654.1 NADPH-dependent oxidoreductase [Planococcus sp. N017]WKA60399.1 NADPH-dependent oxidoreductase [Planococcus sp. N016]